MNPKYTKKDVALYFAGKLDRARRREIEMACKTDAQVRRWFAELTPTDEELENEPVAKVAVDPREYRTIAARTYQRLDRHDEDQTTIDEMGRWLQASPGTMPAPTLNLDLCHRLSGVAGAGEVDLSLAADDGAARPAVRLPRPPYTVVADNIVDIGLLDDEVPYGLVQIVACRAGVPLASTVRVMEYSPSENIWRIKLPIAAIFAGAQPSGKLDFYPFPARREILSWFPYAMVEQLFNEIPETWTEERRRVRELLQAVGK